MYTSMLLISLTGSMLASAHGEGIAWQTDYVKARDVAKAANKPLAVFIGSGAGGQEKVARDGKLSPEILKSLADKYVCLYIDLSIPDDQKLASSFGNTRGLGLVLSDRTGTLQTFTHDGDLSTADLSRWLTYGADTNLAVRTTMTNSTIQTSMYPPGMSTTFSGFARGGIMMGCPTGT